jgi:hypothetical protein
MTCRILAARTWVISSFIAVVFFTGCGSQSPFEYIPVSGKVTYEDGSPVTVGKVFFVPDAPPKDGMHPRTATADLNADGTFSSVTSYKPGDGLVPGKHKVAIMFAEDANGKLLVAKDYTSFATSPLVVDTADAPFEIKVPKP